MAPHRLERVRDRARLLEDLLLHEVAVGPELRGRAARLHHGHGPFDAFAARIENRERLSAHVGEIALLEIDHAPRDREERRGVRSEEVIVRAEAHDQRAPRARTDDAARLAGRDHRDRVRALELRDGRLHGAQQVAAPGGVPVRVDEMRDHLGVGLRDELVAAGLQLVAQLLEVLDDAVVHHRDFAAGSVRVRVVLGRCAVRRPARVRDARGAGQRPPVGLRREVGDACGADQPVERRRRAADHAQPRGVVAAILEPADAVDQDRDDVARADRADDAAHGRFSPSCRIA